MPNPPGFMAFTRNAVERFYSRGPYICRSCKLEFDRRDEHLYTKHVRQRHCRPPPKKKLPPQGDLFK